MIKVIVDKGHVELGFDGHRLDMLAEVSTGFGGIMAHLLEGAPDDLRDEMIMGVFECTLMEIKSEEGRRK